MWGKWWTNHKYNSIKITTEDNNDDESNNVELGKYKRKKKDHLCTLEKIITDIYCVLEEADTNNLDVVEDQDEEEEAVLDFHGDNFHLATNMEVISNHAGETPYFCKQCQ